MHPIYLDYNATTPLRPEVLEAMLPYLQTHFGNPSSIHRAGRRAKQGLETAREQIAALIHANRLGGEPIGEYETFVRNLPFYTRLKQVPVTDDTSAMAFLNSTDRVFLVLNRRDYERLKTLVGRPLNLIGEVTYWNTAGVRLGTLLEPVPEEDLDTVVLVSNR